MFYKLHELKGAPSGQIGQSIVEYTVVLVFMVLGVMNSDTLFDTMEKVDTAVRDNYKGYSYAVSLSDIPDYDTLYHYGMSLPEAQAAQAQLSSLVNQVNSMTFPTLADFSSIVAGQLPTSPADLFSGGSFF